MSSYSSSFFTGEDSTVSLPQFGKPLRSLFLLEDGPGMGSFPFKKCGSNMSFFSKGGGGGVPADSKVLRHFFFASKPPKGGGVRANPKVLRQF